MANLTEPVTIDREWMKSNLADIRAEFTSDGYIEPGMMCAMALRFYQTRVRTDLSIFPEPIVFDIYSYDYNLVAYRGKEKDYVVFQMFVDSGYHHDYGTGQVFAWMLDKDEDGMYDLLGQIMDRRTFSSSSDLLSTYRKREIDVQENGIIDRLEQWMAKVES